MYEKINGAYNMGKIPTKRDREMYRKIADDVLSFFNKENNILYTFFRIYRYNIQC